MSDVGWPATIEALLDLDRYPLHEPGSAGHTRLVARARDQLLEGGASELPGFVTAEGLEVMVADALDREPDAFRSGGVGTAYLELPDESWPDDHPRRSWSDYAVGAVAYDLFPAASPMRRLYEWEPLGSFLAEVLGHDEIHPYADPLGALNLATMGDGDQLQWHFDQTDFVVSMALRDAEDGGDFEVIPRIRTASDERYDRVAAVLAGDRTDVIRLPMTPGTLLIFEGRNSIHRVSPIAGSTTRLVGLLGYDTRPGTMSSELLKLIRYGRDGPITS